MPVFVEVALPVPMRQTFSYQVPEANVSQIQLGLRVKVPFGRQQLVGLITAINNECDVPANKIKPFTALLDDKPLLPTSLYKLTLWAARYYFASQGQMLSQALPVALRKGLSAQPQTVTFYCLNETGKQVDVSVLKRAPAQKNSSNFYKNQPLAKKNLPPKNLAKLPSKH